MESRDQDLLLSTWVDFLLLVVFLFFFRNWSSIKLLSMNLIAILELLIVWIKFEAIQATTVVTCLFWTGQIVSQYKGNVQCRYVSHIMTRLCSSAAFTRVLHYSTLKIIYVEDQLLFHVKHSNNSWIYLDMAACQNSKVSRPSRCTFARSLSRPKSNTGFA